MADQVSKVEEIVQKISRSSERDMLAYLRELSAVLSSSGIQPRDLMQIVPFHLLFGCLNTRNDEQILLCKGILQKLLVFERAGAVALQYHDAIIEGLNHPSSEVRELCLNQLERCSSNVNGLMALVEKEDILQYTARSIGDESLECATIATHVFINTAKHEAGLKLMFEHNLLSEFNELIQKKDVIRFRVYELFISIQALSEEAHVACKRSSVLDKLLAEFDGDNILLRMNCIELLTRLVVSGRNGRVFLEERDMMTKLKNLLMSAESDPLSSLMIPGTFTYYVTISVNLGEVEAWNMLCRHLTILKDVLMSFYSE